MNGHELSTALKSGRRAYGTLITSTSPHVPDRLRSAGLDFVFIDTEHIVIDDHDLSWMCRAYAEMNLVPLVRIPEPDPYRACKVLDGGAGGIIAPYVESVEQVQALRGAVKFRPLKGQKLIDALNGTAVPGDSLASYLSASNEGKILIINIESVPAVRNIDRLLEVPGIDAILIGPHDLSVSLEIPEQYGHPEFDKTVRFVIEKARASSIGVGIHYWENLEQEIAWARCGANLIVHSGDTLLFLAKLREDMGKVRSALGDQVMMSDQAVDPI